MVVSIGFCCASSMHMLKASHKNICKVSLESFCCLNTGRESASLTTGCNLFQKIGAVWLKLMSPQVASFLFGTSSNLPEFEDHSFESLLRLLNAH